MIMGSKEYLMEAANVCNGLPKIFAAVILLNRPDIILTMPEEIFLDHAIEDGRAQMQMQLEGIKL